MSNVGAGSGEGTLTSVSSKRSRNLYFTNRASLSLPCSLNGETHHSYLQPSLILKVFYPELALNKDAPNLDHNHAVNFQFVPRICHSPPPSTLSSCASLSVKEIFKYQSQAKLQVRRVRKHLPASHLATTNLCNCSTTYSTSYIPPSSH